MRNEFVAGQTGEEEGEWRQFLAYLFAQASTGIATTGVLAGLGVTQTATASKSVNIDAGAAVVQASRLNGAKPLVANTAKPLDVLTANPVGSLPRNDLVVFDAATGTRRAIIGTPNAVPTDPAVPALAVRLARLRHAANATTIPTSAIDDLRVMTALAPAKVSDTGWVGADVQARPGWSVTYVRYRIRNGLCELQVRVSNTTTIPASSTGNISDQAVCSLPPECVPLDHARALSPTTPGSLASFNAGLDGNVYLAALPPGVAFAAGSEWNAGGVYLLG